MTNLNFKISELIHSDEANKRKINNMPDINSLDNMLNLIVHCLQPIRDMVGVPINVSRVNAFNRWMIEHSVDNYQKICGKW